MLDDVMTLPSDTLPALIFVARFALGSFFLPSALGKLMDLADFARGVRTYHLLPDRAVPLVSGLLPWIELAVALLLILGMLVPVVALTATMLVTCFTIAVVINLARGRQIACHCHGIAASPTISWGTVARNLALIGLSLWLGVVAPIATTWAAWLQLWKTDLRLIDSPIVMALSGCLIAFWWIALLLVEGIGHLHTQTARLLKDRA